VQSTPPSEELRKVYEECGGDLHKVAARMGLSISGLATEVATPPPPPARRRTPPVDLGHDNIRKYVISVRHCENPVWPVADEDKILVARELYELGTHEMCQGRDRNWFVLYLIPRKVRTGARKFFHAESY
jgi:hypothetical protein